MAATKSTPQKRPAADESKPSPAKKYVSQVNTLHRMEEKKKNIANSLATTHKNNKESQEAAQKKIDESLKLTLENNRVALESHQKATLANSEQTQRNNMKAHNISILKYDELYADVIEQQDEMIHNCEDDADL